MYFYEIKNPEKQGAFVFMLPRYQCRFRNLFILVYPFYWGKIVEYTKHHREGIPKVKEFLQIHVFLLIPLKPTKETAYLLWFMLLRRNLVS